MKRTATISLLATALVAALAANANATILYSANFSNPTFVNGGLVGQDSWVAHSGAWHQCTTGRQCCFERLRAVDDVRRGYTPELDTWKSGRYEW
jgi:hypothetical protein